MNIKRNLITTLFLGVFIFSLFIVPSSVEAVANYKAGTLLKVKGLDGAAVYEIGNDGKKYIYPDKKTFDTWHDDFADVKEVVPEVLDEYNDGGNVTVQPGTRLITHKNTAKVYAVGNGGEVTHIPDEVTARKLYGEGWNTLVSDIDPGVFSVSYRANNREISKDTIPDGSLVEDKGSLFLIEEGQRQAVERKQLESLNLNRRSIIKLERLTDDYVISDGKTKVVTFENVLDELPNYNMRTQHALKSFNNISWDNDGIAGGIGWGVYNTANSLPNSGSNYLINRHGANFLGFTFPKVVNFKGAYFAKTVSNSYMDINDPNGHSATQIRYHFYDENLEPIGTSDWFELQETSQLFAADINVKRVEIEHDLFNTRRAGFTGFIVEDAEWLSMDDVMYQEIDSDDDTGSSSGIPYTLYRDQVSCSDDAPVRVNQVIQLRNEAGQVLYGNYRCVNRYQEQCINDGSFDTYYKEYCTDANGNIIDMGDSTITSPNVSVPSVADRNVLGVKDYPDGTLIRGSDNRVYVIKDGNKVHIKTLDALFKYVGQEIVNVSDEVLSDY